jgi:hypothetical protein
MIQWQSNQTRKKRNWLLDLVGTIFATYDAAFNECSELNFGKDHNWSKKRRQGETRLQILKSMKFEINEICIWCKNSHF